ncbi:MAG: hypothetical protein BMS9Abin29_0911 [Gemmatimonadota bacterium]|nr:MAG: hypothetical protein BMS9Abin29_0911 [Gemmatimonadota bacterium]
MVGVWWRWWTPGRLAAPGVVVAILLLVPAEGRSQSSAPAHGADRVVRATHVESGIRVDGVLDETIWGQIEPITDFLQRDPVDGAPATERTEVRIAYDEDALYFGLIMYDSDPGAIRTSILQREGRIDQDDHVWIALDTYHDGRNAYLFEMNAFGTQGDALFSDESLTLADWNWEGVYRSEARITSEGWVLEVAIPFTTIRFSADEAPEMGIAIRRAIRRKNEDVYWPHIGQDFRGGITQVSQYATLTGMRDLRRGRYMELKPFGIVGAQKVGSVEGTDVLDDLGLDFKYSITSNLTLDLTLNTDFAQVESDNVQINLTRFNLFFPEKREFFLERAGVFNFGDPQQTEIFFSRRVGIGNDIIGGGRLTGQMGPISMGFLSLQTEDGIMGDERISRGANNTVVRLRADVAPRTTVGAIFTNLENAAAYNRVGGADVSARFGGSSSLNAWFASVWDSESERVSAGSVDLNLRNARWGVRVGYTDIAEGYDPGLGFVRRDDLVRYSATVSATPRFEQSPWARRLVSAFVTTYIEGQDGTKQSTDLLYHNRLTFQSGDAVGLNGQRRFERLDAPARIQGRELPAGDYTFYTISGSARTNESRTFSGSARFSLGEFWSGTRTQYGGALTWKTGPNLTLTGSVNRNDIDLPVEDGAFSTTILSLNVLGAINRRLFANALVQYDDISENLQSNVRIDWIHTPGSDLFIVLDTGYFLGNLLDPRDTRWVNRAGVVKLTYLKAF